MKILVLLFAFTMAGFSENPVKPRESERPHLEGDFEERRDAAYVSGGTARQRLDIYFSKNATEPLPLIVWIHGGGWRGGSKEKCPAIRLTQSGFAVASIGYRLSGEAVFPAQIEDCKAAIRWIRAHSREFNIDPKRIGVWGASAGGHLAALLGVSGEVKKWDVGGHLDQSSNVQAVVDWFGPANLLTMAGQSPKGSRIDHDAADSPESLLVGGAVQEKKEIAREASPVAHVDKMDAPILMMHGDRDPLVPYAQSVEFLAVLKKAGVESSLKTIQNAGHGGGGFASADSKSLVVTFLKKHLDVRVK